MFPEAIERDYVDTLRGIVRRIESTVLKKLPQIEPHFNAAVRQDGFSDWFEQCMGELLQAVLLFVDDEKLASMVQVYTKQTADFNRKQFHKVLRSVYQVDIFTTEPWLEEALRMAEWENIQLIKSIPTQTLEKLRTRFMQAVRQGERWEDVVEDVKNVLNSSDKRAILIARDQVGKLNAHLTRLRQQHLGVKSYIWRGMLDERERAHHVEREGKQFDWDNPPDDGHPGEPILCRCYAEAVFPEFGELVGGMESPSILVNPQNRADLPEAIKAIRRTNWSDEFKAKTENIYYAFAKEGIIIDYHGLGRLGERLTKAKLTIEDAIQVVKETEINYIDTRNGRFVRFNQAKKVAVIQSNIDNQIITFERKATPSLENWKPI